MKFKKGDIITPIGDGKEIIFQLTSDAKLDFYYGPWGSPSSDLRWLANGRHIGTRYTGIFINQFHLQECVLYHEFGLYKNIKKFSMEGKVDDD